MAEQTLYNILGVRRTVTKLELKLTYRKLALTYHPDKNVNAQDRRRRENQFKAISEAYAVLSNPAKRQQYDENLEEDEWNYWNMVAKTNKEERRQQFDLNLMDIFNLFNDPDGSNAEQSTSTADQNFGFGMDDEDEERGADEGKENDEVQEEEVENNKPKKASPRKRKRECSVTKAATTTVSQRTTRTMTTRKMKRDAEAEAKHGGNFELVSVANKSVLLAQPAPANKAAYCHPCQQQFNTVIGYRIHLATAAVHQKPIYVIQRAPGKRQIKVPRKFELAIKAISSAEEVLNSSSSSSSSSSNSNGNGKNNKNNNTNPSPSYSFNSLGLEEEAEEEEEEEEEDDEEEEIPVGTPEPPKKKLKQQMKKNKKKNKVAVPTKKMSAKKAGKCQHCERQYLNSRGLNIHMAKIHSEGENRRMTKVEINKMAAANRRAARKLTLFCQSCEFQARNASRMKQHLASKKHQRRQREKFPDNLRHSERQRVPVRKLLY